MDQPDIINALKGLPTGNISSFIPDKRLALHAMIRDCGHATENSQDYRFDNMARGKSGFAVLQYTLAGSGVLELDNRILSLTAGSLMLALVPGRHSYYLPKDSVSWEFVYFVIYGREALRILAIVERAMGNVLVLRDGGTVIKTMHSSLRFFNANRDSITAFDNSRYAYDLCLSLAGECFSHPDGGQESRFLEVKKFIKDNLHRDVSVSEMAVIASLSRSHFTRLFTESEGLTPNTYLEDLRLKTATQLLRTGTMSVKETAFACGYYDVNYFCRVFKRRMGITPGEFRMNGDRIPESFGGAQ
jgi:AraC-like DNA-binding protein